MFSMLYYPGGINSNTYHVLRNDIMAIVNANNLAGVSPAVDKNQSYVDTSITASGWALTLASDASEPNLRSLAGKPTSLTFNGKTINPPSFSLIGSVTLGGYSYIANKAGLLAISNTNSIRIPEGPIKVYLAVGPHYLIISVVGANLGAPNEGNTFCYFYPTGVFENNGIPIGVTSIAASVSTSTNRQNFRNWVGIMFLKTPYGYGYPQLDAFLTSRTNSLPYDGNVKLIPFGFCGYTTDVVDASNVLDYGWITPVSGIYLIHNDSFPDGSFFQHGGKNYFKISNYAIPAG